MTFTKNVMTGCRDMVKNTPKLRFCHLRPQRFVLKIRLHAKNGREKVVDCFWDILRWTTDGPRDRGNYIWPLWIDQAGSKTAENATTLVISLSLITNAITNHVEQFFQWF